MEKEDGIIVDESQSGIEVVGTRGESGQLISKG
jgi:hypothetical protein